MNLDINCAILILFSLLSNFRRIDNAGTNKQHTAPKNTAKLDREHEELKHKQVSHSVSKLIMQGRQAKGLSQKDLATVSVFACLYDGSIERLMHIFSTV